MIKTIENLRTRSDRHKQFVAFGVSFGVTAVVFAIWITSQSFFNNNTQVIAQVKTADSPVTIFSQNVASGYQAFVNTVSSFTGSKNTNQ